MKRHAPATARNSEPLAEVLAEELPDRGLVLEIASGSGEHAVFLARRFPALDWISIDSSTVKLASVAKLKRGKCRHVVPMSRNPLNFVILVCPTNAVKTKTSRP